MTEKQIIKSIKALARGECANYQNGMCLETDQRCHLINPRYDSIRDGMIDCDYFLECVLPADWDLNDLVSYALWYDEAEDDDLPPLWRDAPPRALRNILEAIFAARRQKSANVGWAALSEGLMQTISEETRKWQV